ncbi:MAG: hypothetical protein SFU91_01685 [Chloroherpetonaceae bacterium]|nr:hypothetical protein [Chloroherpetonaceae bacterium]
MELYQSPENDYEKSDINPRAIITSIVVGTVVIAVIMFFLAEFFKVQREEKYVSSTLIPESTLLRDVKSKEDGVINSYGIVDINKQIYRMPVSEAMQKMAEEAKVAKLNQQQIQPPANTDTPTKDEKPAAQLQSNSKRAKAIKK